MTKAGPKDPAAWATYRRLIALRWSTPMFVEGKSQALWPESETLGAYQRIQGSHRVTVICKLSTYVSQRRLLDTHEHSQPFNGKEHKPWQSLVLEDHRP